MILINSGEYIGQELKSEIGEIPPSFLPLKNSRLYKHQIESLGGDSNIFISLPINFNIPKQDLDFFNSNNIQTIEIPSKISLGESIYFSLELISKYSNKVSILHGDTLILDLIDNVENAFAVSTLSDNYNWGAVNENTGLIYAGFFAISNIKVLLNCLKTSNFNFIDALNKYKELENVKLFMIEKWLDFGHVNTYYRSKALMPTLRYFNKMSITNNMVLKSGDNYLKIFAESNWYTSLPSELRGYTPQWLGSSGNKEEFSYMIEYQYLITLNELYVFGDQSIIVWKNIIKSCFNFLRKANSFKCDNPLGYINNDIFLIKTNNRISEFINENPSLSGELYFQGEKLGSLYEIAELINRNIPLPNSDHISVIHGDFCFSNIFYDYRKQDIKIIDPRGLNEKGIVDIFGDIRYDYSKFAHSIIGKYDQIVAGNYNLEHDGQNFNITFYESNLTIDLQDYFWSQVDNIEHIYITKEIIISGMINLFISMLPLHKESSERQLALLANSLKLYKQYIK